MARYAVVKDGVVINVVEYDSQPSNPPPGFDEGCVAIQEDNVSPDWHYVDGKFFDPNPPKIVDEPAPMSLADKILSNPTELAKLKAALGL